MLHVQLQQLPQLLLLLLRSVSRRERRGWRAWMWMWTGVRVVGRRKLRGVGLRGLLRLPSMQQVRLWMVQRALSRLTTVFRAQWPQFWPQTHPCVVQWRRG